MHQAKLAAARIAPRYCCPSGLSTGAQASWRSGRSMPYFSGALRSMAQGVVADLVAQAARAGVDHHADHVLLQAHDRRGLLVEDVIDDLHFEEVVARAERAALLARRASRARSLTCVGLGAVEPAAGLGVLDVARVARPRPMQVADALAHQLAQLLGVEAVLARPGRRRSGRCWNSVVDELSQVRLDVAVEEVRCAPGGRRS